MQFTDVTSDAGINHTYVRPLADASVMAGGAAAADVNGDGWLDIYVAQGDGPNLLYINDQAGGFTDEAAVRGADLGSVYTVAISAADYDNDGDVDLAASVTAGQSRVLINDGTGNFTQQILLPEPTGKTQSSSWGDVDNDGMLELAIGQWEPNGAVGPQGLFLYKNDGGTLTQYEFRTNPQTDIHVFTPRFADLNGDRLSDMHVGSDFSASKKYMNVGGGMFDGSAGHGGANDMGHTIGDYDKDGDLDIFVTDISTNGGNQMYANNGQGAFTNVTAAAGINNGWWGWAASFGDLDLDGDLDIYHVNGFQPEDWRDKPSLLYMNNGDGTFDDVAACAGAEIAEGSQGRGMHMFDYDNDGDLDIFVVNNAYIPSGGESGSMAIQGNPVLLRNDTPRNGNHWLKVTLNGTPPIHRDGIGSRVYVEAGPLSQMHEMHASTNFLSQDSGHIALFGIGGNSVADEVRAEWVTGDATVYTNVSGDQAISLPSPTATVSARMLSIGQSVTATSNESAPVEWEVGGNIFADPVTTSFATSGTKEFNLNVYDASMSEIVRTEIIRVEVAGSVGEPDLISPAPGSTLPAGIVTFEWSANGFGVDDWQLLVGSSVGSGDFFDSAVLPSTTTMADVSGLPEDGSTIHVTLRWSAGGSATEKGYIYTAADVSTDGPAMVSPVDGSTLDGATQTFQWSANGAAVTKWRLEVGTSPGAQDLFLKGISTATTSQVVEGLPVDGSPVYVTLKWRVDGNVEAASYTYTSGSGSGNSAPVVTVDSPASGSSFNPGDVIAFSGTATDDADGDLSSGISWTSSLDGDLGSGATVNAALTEGTHTITASATDSGSATGSAVILVTVGSGGNSGTPTMIAPVPGSMLTSDSETFQWSAEGVDVRKWRVLFGTSPGGRNLLDTGGIPPGTVSAVVSGLPTDGSTVYVTIRWATDSTTDSASFEYAAASL